MTTAMSESRQFDVTSPDEAARELAGHPTEMRAALAAFNNGYGRIRYESRTINGRTRITGVYIPDVPENRLRP